MLRDNSSLKKIYTLGTGQRSIEDFIEIINSYNIEAVIDVRSFPKSKFEHFKRENLAPLLRKEGFEYYYLGKELGGFRKGGYLAYTNTVEFEKGINILESIATARLSLIICAERFPWKCHRRFIARALHKKGWEIDHIIDKGKVWVPRFNLPTYDKIKSLTFVFPKGILNSKEKLMIKEAIGLLIEGKTLSHEEIIKTMRDIMEGKATDAQIASFLTALRMKGETVEEITGAARVMREKATKITASEYTVDTCGTGGDMSHTFNISTTSALIVSACGVPVAKHGNRSVSSQCGSADVLEALGVKIDLTPDKVQECLNATGFGFLFAPLFHPAMKYAIGPRREMGIRTIFNILGPLTNPAGARRQVLGVFSDNLTETIAEVLGNLGAMHAFVVHGEDGLDEITNTGRTKLSELKDGRVNTYYIAPEDLGLQRAKKEDLLGGTTEENAKITTEILSGRKGPKRDIALMNASAALIIGGVAKSFSDAMKKAVSIIDSGKAYEKLEEIKVFTNRIMEK